VSKAIWYGLLSSLVFATVLVAVGAGYLYKRSCTFRFDRIQDIDTFSGPIHTLLGIY
jgi:hypothetical protein